MMAKRLALVRLEIVQLDDRRLDHVEASRIATDVCVNAAGLMMMPSAPLMPSLDPLDDLGLTVRLVKEDREADLLAWRRAHLLDLDERRQP